jgi:hypothetical protein
MTSRGVKGLRLAPLGRRGVTLVMMALMMFLILGMSALVVDYGMIKASKAEAQRATDAAALAGASAFLIADPETDYVGIATARAHEFAHKHAVRTLPIVDGEDSVTVNVAQRTVKVDWYRGNLPLWFASMFGSQTMGVSASSTARASESGVSNCLKPVAVPDIWQNNNKTTIGQGNKPVPEDRNNNNLWDYTDDNGNRIIDPGEMEPWTFNEGDVYDPPTYGYGSGYRNGVGSGYIAKTKDYGRQVLLQTFDPKDALVSSYFRTWGENANTLGTDSMAAAIRGQRCTKATVGTEYRQGNGAKEPLGAAWEDVIKQDPSATWNDGTNSVDNSAHGDNWLNDSPRVVTVGLYSPDQALKPQDNPIKFSNFAKLWVDQRPCAGPGACKNPITARFLGYVQGGAGGAVAGSLIYHLVLIK